MSKTSANSAWYTWMDSASRAKQLDCPFNWRLRTVPGVGHEFEKMGAAAAELVFGSN